MYIFIPLRVENMTGIDNEIIKWDTEMVGQIYSTITSLCPCQTSKKINLLIFSIIHPDSC